MGKDITKNTYKYALLFLLLLSKNCFANPIVIGLDSYPGPAGAMSKIGLAILINSSVDSFVIALGYALIKRFYHIMSLGVFKYLLYVVIIGFAVDAVVVTFLEYLGIDPRIPSIPSPGFAFIFLFLCNVFLSRSFWELPYKKAVIIGMMMGLFTNPYFYLILFD